MVDEVARKRALAQIANGLLTQIERPSLVVNDAVIMFQWEEWVALLSRQQDREDGTLWHYDAAHHEVVKRQIVNKGKVTVDHHWERSPVQAAWKAAQITWELNSGTRKGTMAWVAHVATVVVPLVRVDDEKQVGAAASRGACEQLDMFGTSNAKGSR